MTASRARDRAARGIGFFAVVALAGLGAVAAPGSAQALDVGPRTIDCDYAIGGKAASGRCRIVGNGVNQGVTWVVFEAKGRRFRWLDSDPDVIERIDATDAVLETLPVRNATEPCRTGGRPADVYAFGNGDRVCLYWP